ncbi:MAG: hypothetical protein JWN30_1212 [Bacilli bacterium]|nr:hypothetical protein [Bacilli bacterium]
MTAADRLLLFVYSVLVAVLCVFVSLITFGLFTDELPLIAPWEVVCVAVLLFLISLRFIFYRTRPRHADKQSPSIITRTENGEIRISIETLESLVLRAGRSISGISDLRARIRIDETGLRIAIRLIVEPDVDIPATCSGLQTKVKAYVSSLAGVNVEQVIVSVKDLRKLQVASGKMSKAKSRDLG